MLKQKLKLSIVGDDLSINLALKSSYNLAGLSDDVERLVTAETESSINNTADGEKMRFMPQGGYTFTAYFYLTTSSSYVTNVAPNEFASTAVTLSTFQNSFYVYKVFDSINENVQNLLHTGYLNGFNFKGYSSNAYPWTSTYEYADIHLPNSFLDGITANTFNAYVKMNFYSAKSGKVYPFSRVNPQITNPLTENGLYNTVTFNKTTKTYSVSAPYSFYEITNPAYVNIVNESIESLAVESPTYPSGNTFTLSGQYVTVQ